MVYIRERGSDASARLGLLLVSSGLALAGAAEADTPPPSRDQMLLVRQNPEPIPEAPQTQCATPEPAPAAESGPRFGAIEIVGSPALAQSLNAETARFVGSAAGPEALAGLTHQIDCLYQQAGFAFARSRLEPDPASADPLRPSYRLSVDEGRLGRIEAVGGSSAERDFVMRAFSGVTPGKPIRFADIRRGQALARFYNVWGVETQAERDPRDPEHVVLLLKLPPPRPQVFVSVQNASRASVGRWSAAGIVTYHLPTPFYDEASVALFTGLLDQRQVGGEVAESVLLGKGFGLHATASAFQERPSEPKPFVPYVGTTELAQIEATQLVPTHGGPLLRWRVGLEAADQTVKQKTGLTTERDHLRVAYAGVRLDGHVGSVLGWGEVTVRQGLDVAGASRPGGLRLSRADADPQATDLRFTGRLERPFAGGRLLSLDLRGQWTDRPLLLFEHFSYGGLAGGRGLDPDALLGDRGLSGHVEWDDKPVRLQERWTVRPLAYVDTAWILNVGPSGPGVPASGRAVFGGLGGRFSWSEKAHLDVAYTTPLTEVRGVAPGLSGPRMVVTLSAGF